MNQDIRLRKSLDDLWQAALPILRKAVSLPNYEAWIQPLQLLEIKEGEATIAAANQFGRDYVRDHFLSQLTAALTSVTGESIQNIKLLIDPNLQRSGYSPSIANITVVSENDLPDTFDEISAQEERSFFGESQSNSSSTIEQQRGTQTSNRAKRAGHSASPPSNSLASSPAAAIRNSPPLSPISQGGQNRANLNPKYAFDSFVVGSHNRFCYSAAKAVAEKPGQSYSPLFIYGGVGLGKTHLMQAIGHEILRHSPQLTVRYITCERFTNELINSIRDDRMGEFRKRYRQVDVLLVDDIQFIQGKESTQEEFFHTFNTLRDHERQIVLSSDRPPKAISLLEERLRSRFEWGLIADIQAPDLETRVAILKKKCGLEGMSVSDDALEYIASIFTTNIRELEGALIRAHAYASLAGSALTPSVLAGILQPVGPAHKARVTLTIEKITDIVASHYRVESSELKSSKRSQDLAVPRHVAMYLAHELGQLSFPRIGQFFGNRKHTSVLYAHGKIKEQLASDHDLNQSIQQIKQLLLN